jgi:hypothetical protein
MVPLKWNISQDSVTSRYTKPPEKQFNYGTAGFRDVSSSLNSTVFRCGLLAALRSHKCEQTVGLMITASHNPEPDNGVKMVESNGVHRATHCQIARFPMACHSPLAPVLR